MLMSFEFVNEDDYSDRNWRAIQFASDSTELAF